MAEYRLAGRGWGFWTALLLVSLLSSSLELTAQQNPVLVLKGPKDAVASLAFSPDGKSLAVGSFDMTVQVFSIPAGTPKQTLKDLNKKVSSVTYSPDGKILAGGSWMLQQAAGSPGTGKYGGEIKLWNAETGSVLRTLTWRSAPMWALDYSPKGDQLAAGTGLVKREDGKYYGQVILWDVQTGEINSTLTAHSAPIWSVALSPDGLSVAAGSGLDLQSNTYEVLVWSLPTGRLKSVLRGHTGRVISVSFAPSGDVLASASADHTVRLWDMKTGTLKQTLARQGDQEEAPPGRAPYSDRVRLESPGFFSVIQRGWTNSVDFSRDEKYLAAITGSKTIRIWEVSTGKLVQTLDSPARGIYSIVFSPDGQTLASGNADGSVLLWKLSAGK